MGNQIGIGKLPASVVTPQQKWKLRNPEKVRQASREYYLKNKERIKERDRVNKQNNPKGYSRDTHYKHKYGLSLEDYNNLLIKQHGVCLICKLPEQSQLHLAVDHCHKTNKIRGLLCFHCNSGLGKFKDDPRLLQKALEYLNDNQ